MKLVLLNFLLSISKYHFSYWFKASITVGSENLWYTGSLLPIWVCFSSMHTCFNLLVIILQVWIPKLPITIRSHDCMTGLLTCNISFVAQPVVKHACFDLFLEASQGSSFVSALPVSARDWSPFSGIRGFPNLGGVRSPGWGAKLVGELLRGQWP